MKERLRTIRYSERAAGLYGVLTLLVCLHYLFLFPERFLIWAGHEPVFNALRACHEGLIMLLLALFVMKLRRGLPEETWLLVAYCGWMLITRLANRDYTINGALYFSAICFAIFAAGAYLTPRQRGKLVDVFACVTGVFLFLISVLALTVWFGGKENFPVLATYFSNNPFGRAKEIIFFNTAHNMSASWFAVSLFLSAYEWTLRKDRLWRIPLALHMAMMLIIISLQHCRSIQMATSVGIGMLAVLAALPRLRGKGLPVRIAAIVLIVAFAVPLCFKGMDLCGDLLTRGLKTSQEEWETYLAEQKEQEKQIVGEIPEAPEIQAETDPEPGTPPGQTDADTRNFLEDALTLTERTLIWDAGFRLVRENRHAALFGLPEETMMEEVNSRGNYTEVKQHMHNLLMQALVLTGIPGALMLLAFVCLQLFRMVRGYFDASGKVKPENKVLIVLLAVLLIYGMMEVLLTRLVGFASLSFLLVGGICTEYDREVFRG